MLFTGPTKEKSGMTKLHKVPGYFFVFNAAAILCAALCLSGCGKKGPPVPPRQVAVPAVNDLVQIIEGDRVILTWTVPEVKEKKGLFITGFVIYRAKNPVSESACKNCPVQFKPVAEVMVDSKSKAGKVKYAGQLEKGFRYFFKVTGFIEDTALVSKDSNIIEFDY